jgi:sugar lactone lactonase YvrE
MSGRNLKVHLGAGLLTLIASLVMGTSASAQRLPDGFFPESIAASRDGTLFVGSAVESTIVKVPPGADAALPFVAAGTGGLMSVQGLFADDDGGRLYVCTGDLSVARTPKQPSALLAFDLDSGALQGRWELPGGGFCNDIARSPDGLFYISDTANPRILRFDPRAGQLTVWAEHPLLGGAPYNGNGIAVDDKAVYLTTFADGRLLQTPVADDGEAGTPTQIALPRALAGADALRLLSPDRLIVFENDIPGGHGRVSLVDLAGPEPRLKTFAEGLAEPVSGVVRNGQLFVVESQFRKLFGPEKGAAPAPFQITSIALPRDRLAGVLTLPAATRYPNGIAQARDGTLYVGQVTSGRVLRKRPGQDWDVLFPGSAEIYAGSSLRLDESRGLLWGASPDFLPSADARPHRIFALDVRTGAVRRTLTLPDGGFGNDLALAPDGTLYVTDSRRGRIMRVRPGAHEFKLVLEDSRLAHVDGIGASGIARAADGTLVMGNYGSGCLYVLDGADTDWPSLRALALPRSLENPDGIAFGPDGALIVLEGAVVSGDGKVLRIADPLAPGMRTVETLLSGLESPVNLTIGQDGRAWVTEARIRHRLIGGREHDVPTSFRILEIDLETGDQ